MFLSKFKVARSHGKQYIKDLDKAVLPEIFRGRPMLRAGLEPSQAAGIELLCPTRAFRSDPLSIDLGRCVFCGECQFAAPDHVRFTHDHRMATAARDNLIIRAEGSAEPNDAAGNGMPDGNDAQKINFGIENVREEIYRTFSRALKLRQVCAGGDNSTEMELNASMNVNFDFGRYGIDFVASPRHADGIVVTGPITRAMAEPLEVCWEAIAEPKILIVAGTDAISGGVFADSPAIDRTFLDTHKPDLWVPGNPVHPLTFIDGVLKLVKRIKA